jgi:hypothetical protein
MSTAQAPTNYNWTGNTLTYNLPSGTVGLKLKYKKDGQSDWLIVFESYFSAPSSCVLPSSVGPTGTIYGATMDHNSGGWGEPDEESITNTP